MTAITSHGTHPVTGVLPAAGPDSADRPRRIGAMTADDWWSVAGGLLASLAVTWLLYNKVLPTSGKVGFFFTWYVLFIASITALTALTHPKTVVRDRFWASIVSGAALLILLALGYVLIYTFVHGWAAVHHLNFVTHSAAGVAPTAPLDQGGITHAIVGSLVELAIASCISIPLGIGTAIFMVEVGGRFARIVRTVVEAMTALPDILAGLFIYAVLILTLGFQREGFCAGAALSVMMLPIIARSADVALRVVPAGLREASYALGASRWRTVWSVVLPTARSSLATSVILGMARAIGETAPVLITSGASPFFTANPFNGNEMNSLPLYIITAIRSGEPVYIERGFGAAVVLLALVLILFVTARLLSRQKVGR